MFTVRHGSDDELASQLSADDVVRRVTWWRAVHALLTESVPGQGFNVRMDVVECDRSGTCEARTNAELFTGVVYEMRYEADVDACFLLVTVDVHGTVKVLVPWTEADLRGPAPWPHPESQGHASDRYGVRETVRLSRLSRWLGGVDAGPHGGRPAGGTRRRVPERSRRAVPVRARIVRRSGRDDAEIPYPGAVAQARRRTPMSSSFRILVTFGVVSLAAPMAWAEDRALIVSVGEYRNQWPFPDLKGGARNVALMREVAGHLGFSDDQILVVEDEKATYSGIKGAFRNWLTDGVLPGERALFYFSGHGYYGADGDGDEPDGKDEILIPHDYGG